MTSPICLINGSSTLNGSNVNAGSTVNIALQDTTGVSSWSIKCTNTDGYNTPAAINATLSVDDVNKTATFTAPNSAGSGLQFTSIVNNGIDVNGSISSAFTTTFGVWVVTGLGDRVLFPDETLESDPVNGWSEDFNRVVRRGDTTSNATTSTSGKIILAKDLGGTYSQPLVVGMQGNPIKSVSLGSAQDGYVATWVNADGYVEFKAPVIVSSVTMGGDVTGNSASSTVAKINGSTVSSSPTTNTVLVATGSTSTAWQTIVDANVSASAAITGTKVNPAFGSQAISNTSIASIGSTTGNNIFTGGFRLTTRNVITSSFTVDTTTNDCILMVDTSPTGANAAVSITLPTPTSGRTIFINDATNYFGTNNLTIVPGGGVKIDGSTSSVSISTSGWRGSVISDGTNWFLDGYSSEIRSGAYLKIDNGGSFVMNSSTNSTIYISSSSSMTSAAGASISLSSDVSLLGSIHKKVRLYQTPVSTYQIDSSGLDNCILVNTNYSGISIQLPTPTSGREIIIKDWFGLAATNNFIIKRKASEKIDNSAADITVNTNHTSYTFISDGTDWFIISKV